jgi:long-chain acyl-CoA synthetase
VSTVALSADRFFAALRKQPQQRAAVVGAGAALTLGALLDAVDELAEQLLQQRVRMLASRLGNGPAWIVADLAALRAGIVHVPLPLFFSEAQQAHALRACGADAVLEPPAAAADGEPLLVAGQRLRLGRRISTSVPMPSGTRKVTFTSGSTATPKGVCLGDALFAAVDGVAQALAPLGVRRHLCALPLPLLLENLAGVLAPLASGATVLVPSSEQVGLRGSSGFDPAALDAAARASAAESLILVPQMLRAWSAWREATRAAPLPALKFVAVGGAPVGAATIARARAAGLPAYEGYGLSEAASVQTLNLPGADRPGSAGRPLPHARLRIDGDGQIWIAGSLLLGYLGAEAAAPPEWWPTGDLGRIEGDGFLHIDGRRGNVLATSFGRKVSPEWVECELQAAPAIAQAVVFGDGQPRLATVLWPARDEATDDELAGAVAEANRRLPDYARIGRWLRGRLPFTAASGMATANGRPRRDAIARVHRDALAGHPAHHAAEAASNVD